MIAFDAVSTGSGSATSFNVSHTTSGSDRFILTGISSDGAGDVITGASYNGTAMTFIGKLQYFGSSPNEWMYLYYLENPTVGTNNVTITKTGGATVLVRNISYTGVKQSGALDNFVTHASAGSPATKAITTVADNCWTILFGVNVDSAWTASTGSTARSASSAVMFFDSNGPVTPAGSYSMSLTYSGPRDYGLLMISIAPAVAAAARTSLPLLGVG